MHQTRSLEEVRLQDRQQLEEQTALMRSYLMEHVMPALTQALVECCRVQPPNPVEFLVLLSSASRSFLSFQSSSCLYLVPGRVPVQEQPLRVPKVKDLSMPDAPAGSTMLRRSLEMKPDGVFFTCSRRD